MSGDFDRGAYSNAWNDAVRYNTELNTVILSRDKLKAPYFSREYPLAVNFARLGRDMVDTLLKIVDEFNEDYKVKAEIVRARGPVHSGPLKDIRFIPYGDAVAGDSKRCLVNKLQLRNQKLPQETLDNLYNEIRVARIATRSLDSLIYMIDNGKHVTGMGKVTFKDLGLTKRLRQPGLRQLDERQLYSVAYMQNFCSEMDQNYAKLKPFIELEVSGRFK